MKEEEDEDKIELKAVLLGNSGVGKTNLINTCVGLEFKKDINSTTTSGFVSKKVIKDGKEYIINLWDTAGQEIYKSITKIIIKKSKIVLFVYDITDRKSFNDLKEWIKIAKEIIDNDYISAIVGNKSDLFLNEQVSEEEARKFAEQNGMEFQLASAKEAPKEFSIFLENLIEEREGMSKSEIKGQISLTNDLNDKKENPCNC